MVLISDWNNLDRNIVSQIQELIIQWRKCTFKENDFGTVATDQKSLPNTNLSGGYTQNIPDINNFVHVVVV